jgi:hypothetical protein
MKVKIDRNADSKSSHLVKVRHVRWGTVDHFCHSFVSPVPVIVPGIASLKIT